MTDDVPVSPAALPAHAEPAAEHAAEHAAGAGAGARLRSLLPDLAPWRASADFRRLWLAGLITNFGSFLTFVALPVQMKVLTGSAVAVGAIGAVELVPLIVFGLYGGALADALDKRKLILYTEAGQGLLCGGLLVNALMPRPAVWPLYVVAALSSALGSVQRPALDSLVPRIVAHEHLPAAASLNSLRWSVGGVAGPALAGVVVAYAGLGWAYAVDLVTFVVSVVLIVGLAASPAAHEAAKPSLASIAQGARYAWNRKELLGTYVIDLAAMFFAMPLAVLPFLADELHAAWSLGLMYAALPAGAMLVTLTQRVDLACAPARADGGVRGGVLGARDGGGGGRARRVAGAAVPGPRRLLRHGERDLPGRDVGPDDSGRATGATRRDRAALVLRRAPAGAGTGGRDGGLDGGTGVDLGRGCGLRGSGGGVGVVPAAADEVRRTDE